MEIERNKFSYRNSPILTHLEKGNLEQLMCLDVDAERMENDMDGIEKKWGENVKAFRSNIWYITTPFYEAIQLAEDKLLTPEMSCAIENQSGTFISGDFTTCFAITNNNGEVKIELFSFEKTFILSKGTFIYDKNKINTGKYDGIDLWLSNCFFGDNHYFTHIVANIIAIVNFIRYAKIETKELKPNSKIKDEKVKKYINDTKHKITILDSKWFTTLIKSDGFKVRGHFRLQPCGVGRADREIIWISDFEKTGYTAPARKLTQEQNMSENAC